MENTENTWRLPSRVKKVLWILLAAVLVVAAILIGRYVIVYRNENAYLSLISGPQPLAAGQEMEALPDDDPLAPAGFSLAAERGRMRLYVKQDTAEVAVLNAETGEIAYSNPPDADQDTVARATNLEYLKSQFILSYLDANAKEGTAWSSYAKSVANGQVAYESIDDGVRVMYSLSNEKLLLVPDCLTAEWYAVLAEAGRKQTAKSYELNEETGLYELKTQGVSARNRQQIDLDAREAGFTLEDYEAMQALRTTEDEEEAQESLSFTVTLDWRLTEDGVEVAVPYNGLEEFGGGQIRAIQLAPFFGAAGTGETGDLVVPDGSGAVLHFNNGKTTSPQYNKNVYDLDLVDSDFTATQNAETVRLALFGICRENGTILATCEHGASLASITADVAGRNNSYNYAYFTFNLRRTDTLEIAGEDVIVAEKNLYPVDCAVRYTMLGDQYAGYSGLARAYRERLMDEGVLRPEAPETRDIPFYYDVIGGVKETAHWLGVQYLRVLPMTTFAEAESIVTELKHENINNQRMNLQGWMNGGYYHDPVRSVKVLKELGGEAGLKSLAGALARSGGALYPDAAIQRVTDIAHGFMASEEASRYYARATWWSWAKSTPSPCAARAPWAMRNWATSSFRRNSCPGTPRA